MQKNLKIKDSLLALFGGFMSKETAEYQVKARSDIRNALEVLKRATLQVLYAARNYVPLQLTAIREQRGDNS